MLYSWNQLQSQYQRTLLGLREKQNALQLLLLFFTFFSFFCQLYLRLRNYESVFLVLKILQHGTSRQWVQLFPMYPCKNWYLHFYEIYDHHIWQGGRSTAVNSNKTNERCWWRHDIKITWWTKIIISAILECL